MMTTGTMSRSGRNLNSIRRRPIEAKRRAEVRPVEAKPLSLQVSNKEATSELLKQSNEWATEYLGGKEVRFKIIQVPIKKLRVWPDNPRTAGACEIKPRTQEEEIDKLLDDCETSKLSLQLGHNGGPAQALIGIVNEDGDVELADGNRRGVSSMVLANVIPMPKSWPKKLRNELAEVLKGRPYPEKVPVKIYEDISRHQLKQLLTFTHHPGPLQWKPFQKGHFALKRLSEESSMDLSCKNVGDLRRTWKELMEKDQDALKKLAIECGVKPQMLRIYTQATIANVLYCQTFEVDKQGMKFNSFVRAYAQCWFRDMASNIQPVRPKEKGSKEKVNFLYPDKDIEEKFMQWLAGGLIIDCLQVDKLDRILDNPKSAELFLEHGAKAALDQLDQAVPDSGLLTEAVQKIDKLDAAILKKAEGAADRSVLRDLKDALGQLEEALGEEL